MKRRALAPIGPAIAILGLALLAACGSQAPSLPPGAAASESRAVPSTDLTGHWRVAELDRVAEPQMQFPIDLVANADTIWWEPACAGHAIGYEIGGSEAQLDRPALDEPRVVCDIGYPADLPRVFDALDAADSFARINEHTVRLAGGGRSVTLSSR